MRLMRSSRQSLAVRHRKGARKYTQRQRMVSIVLVSATAACRTDARGCQHDREWNTIHVDVRGEHER